MWSGEGVGQVAMSVPGGFYMVLPHNPAGADKSEGRGVGVDSGGGGERTRKMKRKKWKEGASTRKKLQLQIGLLCVSRINQLFAA